jgi:hypothetical protein
MTFAAIGQVFLDGVQFTTDPQDYDPVQWEKRHSVHKGLQGAVTVQDFGTFKKDNTVRLGSGASGFLSQSVVSSFHTKFRTKGATYSFTDWLGNSFTVFIKSFVPVPTFLPDDPDGTGCLYTYSMELQVLNITDLFGVAYTGS